MQHIGLLMVRNEVDVLEEMMAHQGWYFDKIVAMDGSDDGGRELLEQWPAVIKLFRDEEVYQPNGRWDDSCRNEALQWIMDEFGVEDIWIHLLHADEFWQDDPTEAAERAGRAGATWILWGEYRFFLHVNDRLTFDAKKPLRERVTWCAGPWFECRTFKFSHHQVYRVGQDHCTLPWSPLPAKRCETIPRYRHYPYRSPEQTRKAFADKCAGRYWQPDHEWLREHLDDPFVYRLPAPANSPLAAWDNVFQFNGELPEPKEFLPSWWDG